MVRSRREFLKTSSALAAVGLTTGMAGCSDLPIPGDGGDGGGPGGTGGGDFANWFYPADTIRDADHYGFSGFGGVGIAENEDEFDEATFSAYESGFDDQFGFLGVDFDEVEFAMTFDSGTASVLTGYEADREEVVEELEDEDFEEDDEYEDRTVMVGPDEQVAVGVGDDDIVVGRSVTTGGGGGGEDVSGNGGDGSQEDLRSIAYGESWTGVIDRDDPREYRGLHEPVTFQGSAGDVVTIDMKSGRGDTFLQLVDPAGEVVTQDDDGGQNVNSRITEYQLQSSGEYTIIASSFGGGSTFQYVLTLTLISQALDPTEPVTAAIDAEADEENRYGADNEAMTDLAEALGGGHIVGGTTHPEYDDTNAADGTFESGVARGIAYTVDGEESDVVWAAVLEDAEAIDEGDLEDFADDSDLFSDVDDTSVSLGDRVATVEGVIDTDDIAAFA